jgi:hypothetical protein
MAYMAFLLDVQVPLGLTLGTWTLQWQPSYLAPLGRAAR